MRSLLGAPSATHRLRLWRCEYDQLPTSLAHTSVVGPGAESTASTSASRKRLDTAQMATTSHTLVAAAAAAAPSSTGAAEREPDAAEDPAAAASAASAGSSSETLSVAVAERAGSPWSRTTMSTFTRATSVPTTALSASCTSYTDWLN
uniref:Uncharacterized protein n=1 Tax=Ficedula albicollis TaxID=59894 RepID=A0A803W411_FICAL